MGKSYLVKSNFAEKYLLGFQVTWSMFWTKKIMLRTTLGLERKIDAKFFIILPVIHNSRITKYKSIKFKNLQQVKKSHTM